MGWVQLLLLGYLWCYFTCSSMTPSVSGFSLRDDTVETTFRQLCNGVEVELKNCNLRLAEKTEYTTSVEKELYKLKRQIRQIKLVCEDAAQAAFIQISALQTQLDSLINQLGATTSGPANDVLIIMQKYTKMKKLEMEITVQKDTDKTSVLEEQLKVLKAELDAMTGSLKGAKCPAGDSIHMAEVSRLQEEIDKLRRGSGGSADSRRIAELERVLKETLKKLDESGDGTSTRVTVIIKGHEDVLEIQRNLAELQKTQAEFTALVMRLKVKKTLLSDLNEEKEEKGPNPELSKHITEVEKEVWSLEDELEILNRTLSRREGLEKELLQKKKQVEGKLDDLKKDNHDLLSRLLSVQLNLQETQIRWMGDKAAAEVLKADLQKQLVEKEDKISRLLAQNIYLKKKLADITSECDDIQAEFNKLSEKLEGIMEKLPETNLKHILEIITLDINIDSTRESISKEKSPTKIEELMKLLKKMTDELNLKKYELRNNDPSAGKIFKIIEKTKEIQNLQINVVNVDDLDAISIRQRELIRMIDDLDDSNPAKLMLKNMVLLSDEGWLKKLINKITQRSQKEITDLEKLLKDTEETLKYKIAELVKKGSNVDQLTREIVVLRDDVKKLREDITRVKLSSAAQVLELDKKLIKTKQELEDGNRSLIKKDAELAKNVARITQLIEELRQTKLKAQENDNEAAVKIADLEESVRKCEREKNRVNLENRKLQEDLKEARKCTEVHKSQKELQEKFNKEILALSNDFARQVLTMKSMTEEINVLKKKISVTEGNSDLLEEDLKKKSKDLEKVMKELEKNKVDSAELLKLLEAMRKVSIQKDQSIKEYLAEIDALDKDMETLMAKLGSRGDENAQLTLKVLVLKEEMAKLEKLQSDLKQESVEKINCLETEIKNTKNEIAILKGSGCETDKTKKQIERLQVELKVKEQKLDQLRKTTEAELDELAEKLAEKSKKLQASGAELKKKDERNAELIQKLIDLGQELDKATSGQITIKKEAEKQIIDLKIKLKNKEVELSKLKESNTDLEESVRKSDKEKNRVNLQNIKLKEDLKEARKEIHTELEIEFAKGVANLKNDFARQVLLVQSLSVEVAALQKKLSKSEGNADELQVELKKKTEALEKVTKDLSLARVDSAELLKLLEAMRKVSIQKDQSIKEYLAEIDALDKDMETLIAKLGSRGDENAQLTLKVLVLKEEMAKLEKLQSDLKQESVEKINSLETEIKNTKNEIAILKGSGCETDETKKQIARLQAELKVKERNLDQLKKTTGAELNELAEKLAEKAKKLESSGAKLLVKDKENAELIQNLIDLGQKLKEATNDQKTIKDEAEKQINDLKKQLKKKEAEVSNLKSRNTDLEEQVKNKDKDVSKLKNDNTALNAELDRKKAELNNAKQEVQVKEATIATVKKELQAVEERIKTSESGCSAVQEKLKKKEDEVTKLEKSNKETLEKNEELKTQISESDTKLDELERANKEMQKELEKLRALVKENKENAFTVVSPEWDPDTAHPKLILTGKGKVVKYSEFSRFVPGNPERFNTALAALAKTGYDSGKVYWEVDVDIRTCYVVGVAKKSANRKGNLVHEPKHGYWGILRRTDDMYNPLGHLSASVKRPENLTVIGVLLDFPKGEITFYNAKNKKPLYTYHIDNKISEKLFPFIQICENTGDTRNPPVTVTDADSVLWEERS